MFVYLITNTINGKRYVGQTKTSLEVRWNQHQKNRTRLSALHGAVKKYGAGNFIIEPIIEVPTKELANEFEIEYIEKYCSKAPNGYNLTDGGEGTVNCFPNEETRKKMSEAHKGVPRPEHVLQALSEARNGRIFSDESKRKMSESRTGKVLSEETRKKISNIKKGVPKSAETRKRMSEALKRYWEQKKLESI
jgi:group I intron endonuclease